jgi:hypothetical protein
MLAREARNVAQSITLSCDPSRIPEHPMSMSGLSNANVYQRLGVRTIVNASGPSTRLSGGIMRPEVAAAMAEASQWCVDVAELQGRASEILAEATGAEAGYVTAGASAALMLASAACLAGLDPAKMNRLPDTAGMANEVVVARSQRNMYDRAVVQAGARLVEVGIALSPIAMAKASGLPPHPTPRHPTGMPKWDGLIGRALSEGRGRGAVAAVAMVVNLRRRLRDYCARMPSCRSHSYYVGWRNAARTFRDRSSAKRA